MTWCRALGVAVAAALLAACGDDTTASAPAEESAPSGEGAPVANQDHWHAAFALDICGVLSAPLSDVGPDVLGIHSHQDGLIHIHPFGPSASGDRARFGVFAEQVGIAVSDGELSLPDGTTLRDGDDCGGEPGRVALFAWPAGAGDDASPEVISSGVGDRRFLADGERFVLAFLPEDVVPDQPDSVPLLDAPIDLVPPDELLPDELQPYDTLPSDTQPGDPPTESW